ncbi:MAG TPA: arylsulfatase [Verrucomicrobiae bacterium]|nr:arylsulfatase [Verrucomicrobiae bacterium]
MHKYCFLLLLCVIGPKAFPAQAAPKPDIVFILADDLGFYDVGWRGSEIKTPNLDALCARGAKLENFYVQPVCSPTRSSLMTGRYPMRYGMQVGVIRPWADYGMPLNERTLAQALREAGYTTAICGKWHLGSFDKAYWPNARGFDHWYGHLVGALDYFTHMRDGKLDWYRDGVLNHDEGYSTDLLALEACKLILNQPKDKPLFLYVPFNAVHGPVEAPDKYKEMYPQFKRQRQTYAADATAMDAGVGKIVAAVDEAGRRANTLFIFASDNGGERPGRVSSNGPLRAGKHTLYEGGVHACAFATWDGHIKPGISVEALSHIVDWYPTLITLAGGSLKQPLPLDGKDIWPCLTRGAKSPHSDILINSTPFNGAIRAGDWKLVINGQMNDYIGPDKVEEHDRLKAAGKWSDQIELFDLSKDLGEKNNLANSRPDEVRKLRKRYERYASQAVPPKNKPGSVEYLKAPDSK